MNNNCNRIKVIKVLIMMMIIIIIITIMIIIIIIMMGGMVIKTELPLWKPQFSSS